VSEGPSVFKRILQALNGENAEEAAIRESITEAIEESARQSPDLSAQERVMLANLLKFGELKVRDVMVPRAAIVAADETIPLADLMTMFRESQHSRMPLFRQTLDDPTGLIHVKDVLSLFEPSPEGAYCLSPRASIAALRRPILFAPPSMRALDLLLKMQTSHTHLALVIDEYGGTDGLVSIEDIIEEIVGDIADEHDEEVLRPKQDADSYVADARLELEDFKAETGLDLARSADEEIDTLGGLAASLLGRVPQRGEIIAHPAGFEFEVLEADPRRVRRLRVRPVADAAKTSPDAS
jgi:CBS domain containing-hemolysin-like protein